MRQPFKAQGMQFAKRNSIGQLAMDEQAESRETRSQGRAQLFSLQHEIQGFTQCSDPNFLIPPFPVLVSSTGRAWQWQTSSPL